MRKQLPDQSLNFDSHQTTPKKPTASKSNQTIANLLRKYVNNVFYNPGIKDAPIPGVIKL